MRFAVDSSVVIDILLDDSLFGQGSQVLLEEYLAIGSVVICPITFAECAAVLSPPERFESVASEMGLIWDDFTPDVCGMAASMWQEYRRRGGPRGRILADFLIGAHARQRADGILSRDRGFFRSYFQGLRVVEPEAR